MKIIVGKHKIEFEKELINEKEINVTRCEFVFDEDITNDFVKEAYFTYKDKSYKQIIIDNQCNIPTEILEEEGIVKVGVVAYKVEDEEEIIRYNPTPIFITILEGSLVEAENSTPITPSEMEQYEQALQEGLSEVENINITGEETSSGADITITDREGNETTLHLLNGQDGSDGERGPVGPIGPSNTLTIGTVQKGDNANATITGTSPNQVLNLTLPKGDTGSAGADAKINGVNTLTIQEGENISISQSGSTMTISSTGGSGGTSDYEDLENKPSINNVILSGNKSLNDLGIQPKGNYALESDIPTKTSDLNNDSGFIDKNVNNLTNYTLKTNTGSLIDLEINQSNYVVSLKLKDIDGNVISSDNIDLPLESVVVGGSYDATNKKIVLTLENGNTVDIPVGDLIAGLQTEITSQNKLASDLVDDSNSGNKFVTTTEKNTWNAKYDKPSGGIPKTDLASTVQTSLNKADTALQEHQDISGKEDKTNKVTSIDNTSTDTQYPSAKAVYDYIQSLNGDEVNY